MDLGVSMELKREADSNDIIECSHDVKPSVGMSISVPLFSVSSMLTLYGCYLLIT